MIILISLLRNWKNSIVNLKKDTDRILARAGLHSFQETYHEAIYQFNLTVLLNSAKSWQW